MKYIKYLLLMGCVNNAPTEVSRPRCYSVIENRYVKCRVLRHIPGEYGLHECYGDLDSVHDIINPTNIIVVNCD